MILAKNTSKTGVFDGFLMIFDQRDEPYWESVKNTPKTPPGTPTGPRFINFRKF